MQMWVSEVSEVMVLEDFFPFSSDVEAIMFLLLHSPRPVVSAVHIKYNRIFLLLQGEINLKFIWYGMHCVRKDLPSFNYLKNLQLPNYEPPKQVCNYLTYFSLLLIII